MGKWSHLRRCALLAGAVFCACGQGGSAETAVVAGDGEVEVRVGEQRVLLAHGEMGLKYLPDGVVAFLPPSRGFPLRLIVPAGISSHLIEGDSLDKLTKNSKVLEPGSQGEFDNGYAGISGVYSHRDGKLYAFYHAEDQEEMPALRNGVAGFYCRIGTAVSGDGGRTWEKLGPSITSSKAKDWTAFSGQADRGAGEVCVTVSRDGAHLLAYYTEHSRVDQRGVQICMARADLKTGAPVPGTWLKYHEGRFEQSGLGGLDSPVVSASRMDRADAVMPQVSYSRYLGRYVMVFNINVWKEYVAKDRELENSGIYIAFSDDGVLWSEPVSLIKDYAVCVPGKSVSWHPTIIWDDNDHMAGRLVYSHSPRWGHVHEGNIPHFMVDREITLRSVTPSGGRQD